MKVVETAPNAKSSMSKVRTARVLKTLAQGCVWSVCCPFLPASFLQLPGSCRRMEGGGRAAFEPPGFGKTPHLLLLGSKNPPLLLRRCCRQSCWEPSCHPSSCGMCKLRPARRWCGNFLQNIFYGDSENLENKKFRPNPAFHGKARTTYWCVTWRQLGSSYICIASLDAY